jgi:hypothetical protein
MIMDIVLLSLSLLIIYLVIGKEDLFIILKSTIVFLILVLILLLILNIIMSIPLEIYALIIILVLIFGKSNNG